MTKQRTGRRSVWTPAKLKQLRNLLDEPLTHAERGVRLGVSTEAAYQAARKYFPGVIERSGARWSLNRVARLFGVTWPVVRRWVREGWLHARRRGTGKSYSATHDELWHFVTVRTAWPFWSPDLITDRVWRAYAAECRDGDVMLTTMDLGKRYNVSPKTAYTWIVQYVLPGKKIGGRWLVREADLAGFVPPYDRPRQGVYRPRWRVWEDAQAIKMFRRGKRPAAIAARLKRSEKGVWRRLWRLGELPEGRTA